MLRATARADCERAWLLDSGVQPEPRGERTEQQPGLASSANGGGGGGGDSAALQAAKAAAEAACADAGEDVDDAAACVPLLVGNPDSDSLDADSVPCVPAATARQLSTPAAVRFFMQEYRGSRQAQREQAERGALRSETANRMAAEATAAAAALRRLESEVLGSGAGDDGQGSLDYGGCAIDWESDGRGSSYGSFTASTGGSSSNSGGSSRSGSSGSSISSSSGSPNGSSNGGASSVDAWGRSDAMAAITGYAEEPARLEPAAPAPPPRPRPSELSGHFIVCGAEESFCSFVDHLRKCGPADTPIVVLHPTRPDVVCEDGDRLVGGGVAGPGSRPTLQGPIYHVEGSASDAASLRQAGASTARALIYLARAGGAGSVACCVVAADHAAMMVSHHCVGDVKTCQSSRDAPRLGTAHVHVQRAATSGRMLACCGCVTGQPWLQRTRCQLACLLALQPGRCARPSPVAARWSRSAAPGRRCWRMRRPCWQCTVSAPGPPVRCNSAPRVTHSGLREKPRSAASLHASHSGECPVQVCPVHMKTP